MQIPKPGAKLLFVAVGLPSQQPFPRHRGSRSGPRAGANFPMPKSAKNMFLLCSLFPGAVHYFVWYFTLLLPMLVSLSVTDFGSERTLVLARGTFSVGVVLFLVASNPQRYFQNEEKAPEFPPLHLRQLCRQVKMSHFPLRARGASVTVPLTGRSNFDPSRSNVDRIALSLSRRREPTRWRAGQTKRTSGRMLFGY
ncbi:hypothetical protein TbgDal_VIII5295 [Trypanosoma brucei gambiense DAL972]|uniref:Uncharacterized protein n=1 Tax=Trypanosoma brucei gambiense (strain MHOM/CI/86/DAL972) TaxID=679716 RepID=C9ZW01_TRYB9|nr:LOW QUALITY PROTEIN: hypothetical protein TbgDal_VIII5295 [Trypanosoma brucei gambiense DAL972]CBH13589.1 hypothetical protein TbgDal_VIII5295 [Trypanosoma brucei gambiense DAL972]|eukprot:XP_011775866.1 LOW QUALITY PROTEIN: hypothetical protein TbgDal_VIII5295 [Trypanosoma brucei gambiense DAL972]